MAMRGYIDRVERQDKSGLALAWHTARLQRAKKMPALHTLIGRGKRAAQTQTPAQMAAAFRAWRDA